MPSSQVPDDEMTSALALDVRWRQLYCDSRTRDLRLVDTKDQFRTVTAHQDVVFREQVNKPSSSALTVCTYYHLELL